MTDTGAGLLTIAARRTAQAQNARAEADALAVLSHRLIHAGDDFPELLASACELFGMRGAAVLAVHSEAGPGNAVLVEYGTAPHTVADADVSVAIDDKTMLALSGRKLPDADQRLLMAYAAHASVIGERHRAAAESAERQALAEGDRTRTALLAAVSHDLRSPLAAVKAAVSSLRNDDIDWSAEDEDLSAPERKQLFEHGHGTLAMWTCGRNPAIHGQHAAEGEQHDDQSGDG